MDKMYVNGDWRSSALADEIRNPYTGEAVAAVARATIRDAEAALAAAVDGAVQMRRLSGYERQALLERAASLIADAGDELARTISLEEGKPLAEAMGEAGRLPELVRLAAVEGAHMHGETIPVDAAPQASDKLGFTLRQPCGVVVALTPFNYPALLVAHKIFPALAAGNAVILKPASQTPLTALMLTRLLLASGLPSNAMQCITGPGSELGKILCADDRVRKITFTGSTAVGQRVSAVAGVKRLSLELGANCPVIVLSDGDVEQAAAATATGGFVNAGQVCISVQRVLVERDVYTDFLDAVVPRVEQIRVGDPFERDTQLSALITEADAMRVEATIRDAVENGGRVLAGGDRCKSVVTPAVVGEVDPSSALFRRELFGPAVAVTPVSGLDEAIALANDSAYGLGAGVFTADVGSALRFAREVECGSVHVNWTPLWRADLMPYGGLKGSGFGKEGPRYAVEEMSELKAIIFHGIN